MSTPTPSNTATPPPVTTLRPEWLKVPAAIAVSGIGRSYLYDLIREGKIKSALIKRRGGLKGIRLISADSLDAFIESCVEANPAAAQ